MKTSFFEDNFIQSLIIYSFYLVFMSSLFFSSSKQYSHSDSEENENEMDQWNSFGWVKDMSIVAAHLIRASSALLHLSSISHSVHDDDQITFFLLYARQVGQRECAIFFPSFCSFVCYARSLCVTGSRREKKRREKKSSSTTVCYTYNSFGRKI
jgi:hypothetical protein